MENWDEFLAWEKTTPTRYDESKASDDSDYGVEHSIIEATADEVKGLLDGYA